MEPLVSDTSGLSGFSEAFAMMNYSESSDKRAKETLNINMFRNHSRQSKQNTLTRE